MSIQALYGGLAPASLPPAGKRCVRFNENRMMTRDSSFPRELSEEERLLTLWIIQHGNCDATQFLQQLYKTKVYAQCKCGCASIDFEVDGIRPDEKEAWTILGDFIYGDDSTLCGVFVFACGGMLAGLEVYPLAVEEAPRTLPDPSLLRPA